MSHFTKCKTKIRDKELLVRALEELMGKGKVESYSTPTNLYGYQNDQRADVAEVIVRRVHVGTASNDLGFKLQEDGTYGAIISEYDSRKHNAAWLEQLAQKYAYLKVKQDLSDNNFTIKEETNENGEIVLNVTSAYYG